MSLSGNLARLASTNYLALPRLPIPPLKSTLEAYLRSVRPLATEAEFNEQCRLVKDFEETTGPILHESLLKREQGYIQQGTHPFFHFEKYWDDMYLAARCPNPVHISPFYILNRPVASDVSGPSNAARFVSSLLQWWDRVKSGEVPEEAVPQDLSQIPLFVGTARIPKKGKDTLQFHGGQSKHIVVQCGGEFFKVQVLGKDDALASYGELKRAFEDILSKSDLVRRKPCVGVLTTEDRDTWAAVRAELETSADNAAHLQAIDEALFMVSLDHGDTSRSAGAESLSKSLLHGSPTENHSYTNRWYDKHQLVVDEAGNMGITFEHSFSDGASWNKVIGDIWESMQSCADTHNSQPLPMTKLTFTLSPTVVGHIEAAEQKLVNELVGQLDASVLHFDEFGRKGIKSWKMPPDAFVQQALQAAYQSIHRKPAAAYEACAMRGFFHGRTETIRSCTTEACAFAEGLIQGRPKEELRTRLEAAVRAQSTLAKAAAAGQGIDRHLLSLKMEAEIHGVASGHQSLGFLSHPLYSKSSTWVLSTSNVTAPFIKYFGFGPVTNEGYGLGYMVSTDHIPVSITSWRSADTSSSDMKLALDSTLKKMRDLYY